MQTFDELLEVQIKTLPLFKLTNKLDQGQYFKLIRLGHGFWDRITDHTTSSTFNGLKQEMSTDNFLGNPLVGHYLDILEMLRSQNDSDTFWCIYHLGGCWNQLYPKAVRSINICLGKNHVVYDARIWKLAIINNCIVKFLESLRQYKVVVVGIEFLTKLRLHVDDFITVGGMLSGPDRAMPVQKFREVWLEYHDKQRSPVVYLTQLATPGAWIISRTEFPNAFVIDMGMALNYWLPRGLGGPIPWVVLKKTTLL